MSDLGETMIEIIAYLFVIAGVVISAIASHDASWSYEQALKDEELFRHDTEESQLTARLRVRNAWSIVTSTQIFFGSGMMVLGLMFVVTTSKAYSDTWYWAYLGVLFITATRSMIVQLVLHAQAKFNRHSRIELIELKEIREKRMSRKTDTKVLIVEDDPILRKMLRVTLLTEGYQVDSADTGEDGIYKAGIMQPHVILWDIGLPDGNNASWMVSRLPPAHIVFVTGRNEVKDLPLGATLLTKPVSRDPLVATIEGLMGRGQRR